MFLLIINMSQYVCAFRGRRDNYQVPLALAEKGWLDQLITDFYAVKPFQQIAPILPETWQNKLAFRSEVGIPLERVSCLWRTTLLEHSRHHLGFSHSSTYSWLDQNFAHAAMLQAQRTKSDLLLYEPYAWEAFRASYRHTPRRVLFQYHPHTKFQDRLLTEDLKRFPFVQHSYQEETANHLSSHQQVRVRDCWQHADLILCASSFTQKTLVAAGAEPNSCEVIPYGIDAVKPLFEEAKVESFQALFVGSGIQRKGLHHLLYAWRQARLPKESLLTLVCRNLDPGIEALIHETPQVHLIRGTDVQNLRRLYLASSLFVMPSLIEGFGQVFLEALSHGCPVLGTFNTCLPDLGGEADGIFLSEVGNLDQLTNQLEYLAKWLPANPELRQKARSCAERFSFSSFRSKLRSALCLSHVG
jgi:glycosyltransferase involved in cell wall biosynthesis